MTSLKNKHELVSARAIARALRALADPVRAKNYRWFFKTGKGEYGEGDVFIGVAVPQVRAVAKRALRISLTELHTLLASTVHEDRLCALIILTLMYPKADVAERERIYRFYLSHTDRINNWDLVDVSCYKIVGAHLERRSRTPLRKLAKSSSLWERRIAIVSTAHFIANNDFDDTLAIARTLMSDHHDLIHKAVGWMLREVGKRDVEVLRAFLKNHAHDMPRTMLRYAIERMSEEERGRWRAVTKAQE